MGKEYEQIFLQEEILANMPIEKRSTPNQRNGGQKKKKKDKKPFYDY